MPSGKHGRIKGKRCWNRARRQGLAYDNGENSVTTRRSLKRESKQPEAGGGGGVMYVCHLECRPLEWRGRRVQTVGPCHTTVFAVRSVQSERLERLKGASTFGRGVFRVQKGTYTLIEGRQGYRVIGSKKGGDVYLVQRYLSNIWLRCV